MMRAEVVTAVTASVVLNVAGLATVDHAVRGYEHSVRVQMLRQKALKRADETRFEFVESPPQELVRPPLKNAPMSDRDSVARDQTPDKTAAVPQAPPKSETKGPADQLGQRRFEPAQAASPVSAASAPRPAVSGHQTGASAASAAVPVPAETVLETLPAPAENASSARKKEQTPSPASAALLPSQAAPGQAGRDRITAPDVARSRSHGAQVYGRTSFEATGSGMGRYMRRMKEKIWLAWFPYLAFHYPKDFRSADAVLAFTLDAQGRVQTIEVAAVEGSDVFAAFCAQAVRRAAPFGPLPEEVMDLTGKDELDVQFAFHFW